MHRNASRPRWPLGCNPTLFRLKHANRWPSTTSSPLSLLVARVGVADESRISVVHHNDSNTADDQFEARVSEKLSEIVEHRKGIEQAKGMLMMLHGIDADAAFELLRWQSQEANVKLNAIALQVIADFRELSSSLPEPVKLSYDNAFMTAHTRAPQHLSDMVDD